MSKSFVLVLLALLLISTSVICVNSVSEYNLSELKNCKYLYADNNNSGSYIYGYNSKTLYCAQLIPNVNVRYVTYNEIIHCVCQNGVNTYALYETDTSEKSYVLVELNMNNGNCNYYKFSNLEHTDCSSIAVTDNKVYFKKTDSHYSYVAEYSFSGVKLNEYIFDDEVSDLFVNNSKVYTRLLSGDIYRLSNGTSHFCTSVISQCDFVNAGKGYIHTDYGKLFSLENNTSVSAPYDYAVYDNSIFYANGKRLVNNEKYYDFNKEISKLLVNKNQIAVMFSDFSSQIIDLSDLQAYKSDFTINKIEIPYNIDGSIICGVENGTTVSEFKNKFLTDISVYNLNGENVTSGLIKTGYRTFIAGESYSISVKGDITGEGNVKSNDISELMSMLTGKTQISGVNYKSADYDLNGTVNNIDLVLIAQKYESEK